MLPQHLSDFSLKDQFEMQPPSFMSRLRLVFLSDPGCAPYPHSPELSPSCPDSFLWAQVPHLPAQHSANVHCVMLSAEGQGPPLLALQLLTAFSEDPSPCPAEHPVAPSTSQFTEGPQEAQCLEKGFPPSPPPPLTYTPSSSILTPCPSPPPELLASPAPSVLRGTQQSNGSVPLPCT